MAATRPALAPLPSSRTAAALRAVPAGDPGTRTRPDLRVVPPRRPTGAIVVASLVVVFGVLLATAALNTMLVSGQRSLDRIETQIREGEQRNQELSLQVAELESPDRIVEAAEAQGMVEPAEVIWLTPRADGGSDAMTAASDPTGDERADGGPGGSGG